MGGINQRKAYKMETISESNLEIREQWEESGLEKLSNSLVS